MKRLTVGILAHVDAGKTTLSEGILYLSGRIRKLGRVDHQNAYLDTDAMERERGITIFAKQAAFGWKDLEVQLLDTPGHVDFSAEMERTLQVLDLAILVVSGTDGVQGHTLTLWKLLERYQIPVFLFVNKMDLPGADRARVMEELHEQLGDGCVAMDGADWQEAAAMGDEAALEHYLADGSLPEAEVRRLVSQRKVFPCYFGSALRLEGVEALLDGLGQYAPQPCWPETFGARVYKISRDSQGARLTHLKVTGGVLRVKDVLAGPEGEEKADQLRLYSGSKFQLAQEVPAGMVCAVTGLEHSWPGQGLGAELSSVPPVLEPVLHYQVQLPQGVESHTAWKQLRQLEEEDPQLHLVWNETLREIHLQPMGEVQMEVLQRMVRERFSWDITFGAGGILYRETITQPVEGVGHFEPLRHYAEVHVLLEPGKRGSGIRLSSRCSEDVLDRNWQRLILTHLAEKTHVGVLTGSPLTDVKITLLTGRAHTKHTEGGDFRQATYRAVRQGLRRTESLLLEPWYAFSLDVPQECVGRAMTDIQRMGGEMQPPQVQGERSVLKGRAPVATMREYSREVAAYTQGRGRLSCTVEGYASCHNADEVIEALGYDCDRDVDNPADSVFCSHGAGYVVPWDQVEEHMHLEWAWKSQEEEPLPSHTAPAPARSRNWGGEEAELQAIFERTYGPVKRRDFQAPPSPEREQAQSPHNWEPKGPEYLLVDGYNLLFAWEDLRAIAQQDVASARQMLMDILCNYQGFRKCRVILVFDAYKVPRGVGEVMQYHNIHVVFTKEAETADAYIEKATYELGKKHRVRVATSDNLEQLIILGHGAMRVSAQAFREEVEQTSGQIAELIHQNNQKGSSMNRLGSRAIIRSKETETAGP
ncbi:MAG: NYN domain-containing protein [Eubacteriales bacterium]|jgi:ribosomal protection tetracycline resistance protein